jgi:uncharacterized membrane protein YdbT with pleckstrin-like domain
MIKLFPSNPPFMLFPDEKIIFKTNPHWLLILAPIVFFLILWLHYLLFICPVVVEAMLGDMCVTLASFAFPFVMLVFYLDWKFSRLYLTNFRLVKERGILGKRFMSIFLEQVQDITCSYGIVGRIFRFGDLEIESAGTFGKMVFKGIPSPKGMKWRIEWEKSKLPKVP